MSMADAYDLVIQALRLAAQSLAAECDCLSALRELEARGIRVTIEHEARTSRYSLEDMEALSAMRVQALAWLRIAANQLREADTGESTLH